MREFLAQCLATGDGGEDVRHVGLLYVAAEAFAVFGALQVEAFFAVDRFAGNGTLGKLLQFGFETADTVFRAHDVRP